MIRIISPTLNSFFARYRPTCAALMFLYRLANRVLRAADGVLRFAFGLLDLAFGLGFGVADDFAGGFLDGAFRLFGGAFNPVFVHDRVLPESWGSTRRSYKCSSDRTAKFDSSRGAENLRSHSTYA